MSNWKRITMMVFVLIGSTAFFGYWSIDQFERVLDNLSVSYNSNISSVNSSLQMKKDQNIATSSEVSVVLATSTEVFATSTPVLATSTQILATSTDLELSFTFPKKGDEVYKGCTYDISWQSSTTISLLGVALRDASTGEVAGPVTGGLPKENIIDPDAQSLRWKVGTVVWPGRYYLEVSKINDIEVKNKSKVFLINEIPDNLNEEEKNNICK